MAAHLWTYWVGALLFFTYLRTNGLLVGYNSNSNGCDVSYWERLSDPDVMNKTIPYSCTAGAFSWNCPLQKAVHLHFQYVLGQKWAVCIRDDKAGSIFTIRDITHDIGYPMLVGAMESCTLKYSNETVEVVLRIDAPPVDLYMYTIASIRYRVHTV